MNKIILTIVFTLVSILSFGQKIIKDTENEGIRTVETT